MAASLWWHWWQDCGRLCILESVLNRKQWEPTASMDLTVRLWAAVSGAQHRLVLPLKAQGRDLAPVALPRRKREGSS